MATDHLVFSEDLIALVPFFNGAATGTGSASGKSGIGKGNGYCPALVTGHGAGLGKGGLCSSYSLIHSLILGDGAGIGRKAICKAQGKAFSLYLGHGAAQANGGQKAAGSGFALGIYSGAGAASVSKLIAFGRGSINRSQEFVIYRVKSIRRIPGQAYAKAVLEIAESPVDR